MMAMASWFSSVALGDKLNDIKDKVQANVNKVDGDFIKKLTLQSDELVSERQRIEEEERRKEAVLYSLAEILPWETRDAEMEILVDECKEVILGLSAKEETFTGPFILAGGLPAAGAGEDSITEDRDEGDHDAKAAKDMAAAEESADKLSKLQPLPTLLSEFDLDTHVGLIQRLLKVDPKLVGMHSRLSSGGQRELIFWKNYFFHCAYTRYEAGLSIDEIWSNESRDSAQAAVAEGPKISDAMDKKPDEEIIFESESSEISTELGSKKITDSGSVTCGDVAISVSTIASTSHTSAPQKGSCITPSPSQRSNTSNPAVEAPVASGSKVESGSGADFEFVTSASGVDEDDGSMDELEAEIAAALDD